MDLTPGGRLIDLSVKTAQLLGFHGQGLARVKVEYVGRAPLAGSDDRKLMATLRENNPAMAPIQVAAGKPFAPAYFDGRPMTNYSSAQIPSPPDRPFRLGESPARCPELSRKRPNWPPQPARAPPATRCVRRWPTPDRPLHRFQPMRPPAMMAEAISWVAAAFTEPYSGATGPGGWPRSRLAA